MRPTAARPISRASRRQCAGTALPRCRAEMSHPDPYGAPDLTPIQVGEIWENSVTRERATVLELPQENPDHRATAELTALVGARVIGEHLPPPLSERSTGLEGVLRLTRDGETGVLREGESAVIEAGVWHDWWNSGDCDARRGSRSRRASASPT